MADAKQVFELLHDLKASTDMWSSSRQIMTDENFSELIKVGEDAIIPLLADLKDVPSLQVLLLLKAIVGMTPYSEDDAGDIDAMARAWLEWADIKGMMHALPAS